jgi:putative ABC transport system permease protein
VKFLTLLKLLTIRNVKNEKFMTFLSIIGVALGIGLFIGVKVASDRAIYSFESDIKGIQPKVNYEVVDVSGLDFEENIYKDLLSIEVKSFPVIKVNGLLKGKKEAVDINGIDIVKSLQFLNIGNEPLFGLQCLITDLNGVVVSKVFADRYAFNRNDILTVSVYDKEYSLKISDVVDIELPTPNSIIMDIGNFQEYFKKYGYLSRIDLATNEKKAEEIRKMLPSNLLIEKKDDLIRDQKAVIASFRYNLQFVSLIAILVGMFLLYNTIFMSVVKRRTEIGILRSLGCDKKTIVMLFTAHGILLGFVGSLLGILLGQGIAYFSVIAVQRTVSAMYSAISIYDYMITLPGALKSLLLGFLVSLVASVVPSFEASKILPHETSREGSFEGRYRKYLKFFTLAGLFFICGGALLSYIEYRSVPFTFPYLSYGGILIIIFGFACLSPSHLILMLNLIKWPIVKIFRSMGKVTMGDMQGSIYRFSIALMSVAVTSALIVSLLTLIFSFRISLKKWIENTINADVYIKPLSCTSNYCFQPLSDNLIATIEHFPEVAGVDRYRVLQVEVFGRKIITGFGNTGLVRLLAGARSFNAANEERSRALEKGKKVAVSAYLGMKYGLQKGDTIELQTPTGNQPFVVADIFSSYSTTSGFMYLDRRWLREYWGRDDATQASIYLKPGADAAAFIQKLKQQFSGAYSVDIMNNQQLRQKILTIFDRSFSITYAIELIAILVSLIGVINTLMVLVFEKKREISTLRYLGMSWKQIRDNLLLSAGITGFSGIILGLVIGYLMSMIFIHVVNKISFGWEIEFRIPLFYLSLVTTGLFLTTLLTSLIPSKIARKIDPKRFISFE